MTIGLHYICPSWSTGGILGLILDTQGLLSVGDRVCQDIAVFSNTIATV